MAGTADRSAVAEPHVIAHAEHPFDPDWPLVYTLLASKCVGCHSPNTDQCDLTTYESLIKDIHGENPLIVPGHPEKSSLFQMIVWNANAEADSSWPDSPSMPEESRDWLTHGQIKTMERWIRNGALEYRLPAGCNTRPLMEIDFPSAKECKICHPGQYEQWARSMHHYAQLSPVFEAFNLTLIERTGGTLGTFCSRCHTPIGTALGENGSRRNIHRSMISREGVTCVVCHRQKNQYYKSNARQAIVPGKVLDTCMFGPFDDPVQLANQSTHPAAGKHFLKEASFCGGCHDVTNPQGVRLEEAFSEWQNSPAAARGITCQNCHMGPVQGQPIPDNQRPLGRAATVPGVDESLIPLRHLSDHTFAGPDYSLLPDTEFPETLDWMFETDYRQLDKLTPHQRKTLTDLRRHNRKQLEIASQKRYQLLKNCARITVYSPRRACPGQKMKIRVDVTSLVAGHSIPTGFTAERQLWVEIVVLDPEGHVIFKSGDTDPNGDLRDTHSHYVEEGKIPVDKYLLNFQNKFMALTQKGTDRSVVLSVNRHLQPVNVLRPATGISASFGRPQGFRIAKGSIPPLRTIGRTYPVSLPPIAGQYHVVVRLNFRHLPPTLLDHIGTPYLKHLLEIVEIDSFHGVVDATGPAVAQQGAYPSQQQQTPGEQVPSYYLNAPDVMMHYQMQPPGQQPAAAAGPNNSHYHKQPTHYRQQLPAPVHSQPPAASYPHRYLLPHTTRTDPRQKPSRIETSSTIAPQR